MSSLLSRIEVEFCSSCNNILLMLNIILKHIRKAENLRLVVYKCKHIYAKCILKLCMSVKVIEKYVRIAVTSYFYNNSESFS